MMGYRAVADTVRCTIVEEDGDLMVAQLGHLRRVIDQHAEAIDELERPGTQVLPESQGEEGAIIVPLRRRVPRQVAGWVGICLIQGEPARAARLPRRRYLHDGARPRVPAPFPLRAGRPSHVRRRHRGRRPGQHPARGQGDQRNSDTRGSCPDRHRVRRLLRNGAGQPGGAERREHPYARWGFTEPPSLAELATNEGRLRVRALLRADSHEVAAPGGVWRLHSVGPNGSGRRALLTDLGLEPGPPAGLRPRCSNAPCSARRRRSATGTSHRTRERSVPDRRGLRTA